MKPNFILVLIIGLSLSCKKSNTSPSHTDISGNWRLKEQLVDPGDGSGALQNVFALNIRINFGKDGKVTGIMPVMGDHTQYIVRKDSVISFYKVDLPQSDTINMRYRFTSRELTLIPPCYERCIYKYVPAGD